MTVSSNEIVQGFIDSMIKDGCAPANANEILPSGEDEYATLEGDRKPGRLAYCLTIYDDGYARGNYINHKTSAKGKWDNYSGQKKKLTKEEKEQLKERARIADEDRERRKEIGYGIAADKARILWESSEYCDDHPYLTRKQVQSHGLKYKEDKLIIPRYNITGDIVSYQTIDEDGIKLNQSGGKKQGCFFKIGDTTDIICIGEGYSTCASVHESTGYCTFVAFDAGNLDPVAQAVRAMYPDAMIIITADNDYASTNQNGELYNIGLEKGKQSAVSVDGFCIYPEFDDLDIDLPSDFNDLHNKFGLDAVKQRIMTVVDANPIKKSNDKAAVVDISEEDFESLGDMELPFKILGYNDGIYYYFPFGIQQIFAWPAASHTVNNLLQLASIQQWKDWGLHNFEEKMSIKEVPIYAFDTMKAIAQRRGVFQEEDRIRGCGVWMDGGRVILHCGDKLIVDNVLTSPRALTSHYVYTAATQRFKHNAIALSDDESRKLLEICCMPTWENELSGPLLAGWLVLAPICAALEWRPHIWITGESGAGKSTLMNQIVRKVLSGISYDVDGGTSESSIREGMGYDARPIIYDEAEGKGNKVSLMDGVLGLAKLSSTGGRIGKRGQKPFRARSCFCFSAINPPIKDFASETRISMMTLKRNSAPNAAQHFAHFERVIRETLTPEFGRRLLARTVENLQTLLTNIKTFKGAASSVVKNARAADQISAMLGGLYLLTSTKLVTEEEALHLVSQKDWTEHTAIAQETDPERLLHEISMSIINVKDASGNREYTIGTLIACAIGKSTEVGEEWARHALKKYSILARPDGIFIGNKNKNLERLLSSTDWALNWNKTLARLNGSVSISSQYFSAGDKQRAMKISPHYFYAEKEYKNVPLDEMEIPFGD